MKLLFFAGKTFTLFFSFFFLFCGIVMMCVSFSDEKFDKSGKFILGGILIGICSIAIFLMFFFRRKKNTTFCGKGKILPNGYETFGTNYQCFKKGIGTGIAMTENKIKNGDTFVQYKKLKKNKPKRYCGISSTLPPGYEKRGNRYSCLKKGYGVGMMMTKEKYFPNP